MMIRLFRALAESQGYEPRSPREAIENAFKLKWIGDENIWLNIMKDRNETPHVYQQAVADAIYARILKFYLPEFLRIESERG